MLSVEIFFDLVPNDRVISNVLTRTHARLQSIFNRNRVRPPVGAISLRYKKKVGTDVWIFSVCYFLPDFLVHTIKGLI